MVFCVTMTFYVEFMDSKCYVTHDESWQQCLDVYLKLNLTNCDNHRRKIINGQDILRTAP